MLETYSVSFGVAVRPICVAAEKYSRISRRALSSAALPRWHSGTAGEAVRANEIAPRLSESATGSAAAVKTGGSASAC